ncbi:suppressor of loss of ypt1 [Mortierella sp. AD094]|nr:suppressor of loss of ypt1 [Mortierella sp. AD094]
MATAATAASAPPLRQPMPYHGSRTQPHQHQHHHHQSASNEPASNRVHSHQEHSQTADALFASPATNTINNGDIPFFDSINDNHNNNVPSNLDNPLMVHVHQLPTPRTSFSSGASSPPENLSPGAHPSAFNHHHHHNPSPHHTPTSLASSSPSSSTSSPTSTLPSTIASTPSHNHVNGYGPSAIPAAKSPLSVSHLYQAQTLPTLRSTSPSLNSTLGPALYGPSAVPNNNNNTPAVNAPYNNGSGIYNIGGASGNTLGGRLPVQAQQYNDHHHQQQQQFQMQQEQLYYDEKELQKKNARSALHGVAAFLPPALNQGLNKVVLSAQAAVSSNSKLSLPSSRPLMDGAFSSSSTSTGLRVDPTSTRGMLMKLYKASKLPILCLLWYLSSAVTNNIGKQIMNQFRYPVTLTFVQFVFVSLFCFILGSGFRMTTIRKPTIAIMHMTAPLVGFQVVGHVFSSVAISRVPLSVVHTIKALSPLFTVVFYRIILGTTYSREVYISLVPLTAGVMLACRLSLEFNNLVGLICALASTLVFVTQNVFTKKILFSTKATKLGGLGNKESTKEDDSVEEGGSTNAQKLDKINILFYSSTMAAICMIPIWLYAEGMGLMFPDESGVYHHATGHSSGFWAVSWLLFLNGVSHFFQNVLAFSVLALTSPVTYSIASLVKRIVVIVASIIYFHQTLGTTQWTGVALTFWGLWLYNSAKNAAKVRPDGGILANTKVGRRVSRNFGRGFLNTDSSLDRKGGFLA